MARRDFRNVFTENLRRELHRIREETRLNVWRPRVSNSKGRNSLQLAWWSLSKPEDQREIEREARDKIVSREYRLYEKKWVGLTLSNVSPFERKAINAFLKPYKKAEAWHFETKFSDSDDEAGYYVHS